MKHNIRIYYEDTDFSGLVYHASYLRFMERGRTEFLRAQGIDQSALFEKGEGLAFAVRHMSIDFLKPARMDDLIQVETQIDEVRGASLIMAQTILRGDDLLIKAVVRIAALRGGKPIRLPSQLASHLACKKP